MRELRTPTPRATVAIAPAPTLILLVTGGRHFGDRVEGKSIEQAYQERAFLWKCLDRIHCERGIWFVVTGAASGADHWAEYWAKSGAQVNYIGVPAKWKRDGVGGGPRRNAEMLGLPVVPNAVLAMPGGSGTRDMKARARAAGLKVWDPPFTPSSE